MQQSKVYQKAIAAFEKAAHGQQRLNSPWHAAKHLERAAECSKARAPPEARVPSWASCQLILRTSFL